MEKAIRGEMYVRSLAIAVTGGELLVAMCVDKDQ